jgi:hypothetical protein
MFFTSSSFLMAAHIHHTHTAYNFIDLYLPGEETLEKEDVACSKCEAKMTKFSGIEASASCKSYFTIFCIVHL